MAPVRLHRVLDLASRMVSAAVQSLNDCLGPRVTATTVAAVQKDLTFYLAQKRALIEQYDIHPEFLGALKGESGR